MDPQTMPRPKPVPVDIDPCQRVDELLTRLGYFDRVRKRICMDMQMLTYCWTDRTPDDNGPYVQPLLRYKSTEELAAVPVHRRMVGGELETYQMQFTNDGINSGNHSVKVEPDITTPLEILLWAIYNGDAAGRTTTLHLAGTAGTILGYFYNASLGATTYDMWPDEGQSIAKGFVLNGNKQEMISTVASVAVSKATRHTFVYRKMGDTDPTFTPTGPTGCTIVGIT